ncbi:LacI family DNA-binding transcriptional regulator [Lentzea nigeriaca]|uniref:LacI family DNA-binding transcriptional regulator n=1 Tax=Lentzea nigeriaca TaxID=1128665 RepID=UPI00195EB9B8|nr:LacI family DNA-binding transcriptional regulator [Lentzea nigeriaca]MBM7856269.1 DNA-binding LacI/PurR family transcriptional regulator [Lentzea nigeriaca]
MSDDTQGEQDTSGSRVTLESVAKRAAVSRQTVSNVLNAPHRVRPMTLQRVHSAIAELGYRPLLAARQLRTQRSRIIGLRLEPVRDGINGAVLDRFLHALTEEAQRGGYRTMLFTAHSDEDEIARYSELLATTSVDAFVLTSTHGGDPRTSWLTRQGVPFVSFGRPWSDTGRLSDTGHSWVDVDNAQGTRAATEYLLSQGHRRIAFLGWPAGSGVGDERREGWRRALSKATAWSASTLVALSAETTDSVEHGAEAAAGLLAAKYRPTAIVCASDSLAIGALSAVAAEPVAVVGFDDTPVAAALGLSSVAQPVERAASDCFELLLGHLGATSAISANRLLKPELVVRRTSPAAAG